MDPKQLEKVISLGLATTHLEVSGDGRHFDAVVVSEDFEGRSMLERHRMVYAALGDRFDTEAVHALSMKTYTPRQWKVLKA